MQRDTLRFELMLIGLLILSITLLGALVGEPKQKIIDLRTTNPDQTNQMQQQNEPDLDLRVNLDLCNAARYLPNQLPKECWGD